MNGDGIPDVVTANYAVGTISVLMGNGDGSFQPAVTYPVGNGPDSVALADVNGDGKIDIIVANSGTNPADTTNTDINTISVLLNNGNGTFAAKQDYATGENPSDIVVADMNNDGFPDLVIANATANTVRISLNNGDGVFTAVKDFPTGTLPYSLAVGDLNGDGKSGRRHRQLCVQHRHGVLFGNGDGDAAERCRLRHQSIPLSRGVAVADINGDGRLDVIVAARRRQHGRYCSSTSFTAPSRPTSPSKAAPARLMSPLQTLMATAETTSSPAIRVPNSSVYLSERSPTASPRASTSPPAMAINPSPSPISTTTASPT